jgi:glycosyltransferase involved in cell wall biosynthesis
VSRIALLVPAYNAEHVLPRLFDSVDAQTSSFDEVLVYDDASTDGTAQLARARGARVITGLVNLGPSRGKNILAGDTSAGWIHFHDSDDALHPEFVLQARRWILADNSDVVLFGTEDRDHESDAVLTGRRWDDEALRADPIRCAVRDTITNCGVYRRDRFLSAGGFNTDAEAQYNEDQAMHLRMALAGLRFRADPLLGIVIYQRAGSMSSGHRIECARAQIHVLGLAIEHTGRKYAPEIGARLWRLAGASAGYGDWPAVRTCVAMAAAIGYRDPAQEHWLMRALGRISPLAAIALREASIRITKPHLRAAMPRARQTAAREPRQAVAR